MKGTTGRRKAENIHRYVKFKIHTANNQEKLWVKEEIMSGIIKYFEIHENKNTIYKNLWNAIRTVLRGKFIAVKTYLIKEGRRKDSNQ